MPAFPILEPGAEAPTTREPTTGAWYVGVTHGGQIGQVAQWTGTQFTNSGDLGDGVQMIHYKFLKERKRPATEIGPRAPINAELLNINLALQWLATLIKSPAVTWEPNQKEAAQASLGIARGAITDIMQGLPPGSS